MGQINCGVEPPISVAISVSLGEVTTGPTKDRKGLKPPKRIFRHRKGLLFASFIL